MSDLNIIKTILEIPEIRLCFDLINELEKLVGKSGRHEFLTNRLSKEDTWDTAIAKLNTEIENLKQRSTDDN